MALDLDPDRVRQAAAAGQSVVFGDAARLQSLMAAGLARANAVVVSYPDTPSALKILRLVREHAPQVPVVVRTIDDSRPGEAARRRRHRGGARGHRRQPDAGQPCAGPGGRADAQGDPRLQDARDARYGLLRGYFHGADDDTVDELQQARLQSVTLPEAAACLGQPLATLALHAMGVSVVGCGAPAARSQAPRRRHAGAGLPGWRHAGAVRPARAAGAGRSQAAAPPSRAPATRQAFAWTNARRSATSATRAARRHAASAPGSAHAAGAGTRCAPAPGAAASTPRTLAFGRAEPWPRWNRSSAPAPRRPTPELAELRTALAELARRDSRCG
jgi:hypothetical protein